MKDSNLIHREELLQTLAAGINRFKDRKVEDLIASFHCPDGCVDFDVPTALDHIANDLYWDEEASWADATHATVRPR